MKRIGHFFYYLWSLLTPVQDVNIWSISLAWKLAGIAAEYQEWIKRVEAEGPPPGYLEAVKEADDGYDDDEVDFEFEFSHWVDWSE